MATMLSLIQQASAEMGLAVPTYVAGNLSLDTIQQLALLNGLGNELQREYDWQALCTEYQFTTQYTATTGDTVLGSAVITNIPSTAGLDTTYMLVGQGINTNVNVLSVDSGTQVTVSQNSTATATGASLTFCKTKYANASDYDRQIDRTQWDKTRHWEMLGPESPQQWQWLKSGYIASGPRIRYRRMGGYFQIWPPISGNELLGMEYVSKNWVLSAAGAGKTAFTVDTDTCIFPDRLMVVGLKQKYFRIKGFGDVFLDEYNEQLGIAKASDGGAATLSFAPQASQVLISVANIPDSGYGGALP